ncbi:MAG: hypothetical protein OEM15_02580 [Myxococcales bacterium]|nr:hypothetical protein [Myxococcales bacterium]MDH3483924.1 hypothetical protein [Myxococcales bacterium]
MAKQYQKKSASRKKRGKGGHGPSRNTVGGQSTGVMGGMVSGFRRAVGSEEAKGERKGSNLLWTAILVTAALAIIAWNFAR